MQQHGLKQKLNSLNQKLNNRIVRTVMAQVLTASAVVIFVASLIHNNRTVRAVLAQVLTVGAVVLFVAYLIHNTLANLEAKHIKTGYDFLSSASGIAIGEHSIPYDSSNSWAYAILVGSINTLKVSILGVIFCTVLGVILALCRLSKNFFISSFATMVVEGLRNLPNALLLLVWYMVLTNVLPDMHNAWKPFEGLLMSKSGMRIVNLELTPSLWGIVIGLFLAILLIIQWSKMVKQHKFKTGEEWPQLLPAIGLLILLPLVGRYLGGWTLSWSIPHMGEGDFEGGLGLTPELVALTFGLSVYTATYVAEVVRAGIQSVAVGQVEAARALALPHGKITRLVVFPQAMRVIIPPLLNQYLNLIKNSSLAYLVGYPDLVSVIYTGINQTSQAIEGISVMMVIYLTISLSVSGLLNWLNSRNQLVTR